MPLHPQSAAYLEATDKLGLRPVSTITPDDARSDLRSRKEGPWTDSGTCGKH